MEVRRETSRMGAKATVAGPSSHPQTQPQSLEQYLVFSKYPTILQFQRQYSRGAPPGALAEEGGCEHLDDISAESGSGAAARQVGVRLDARGAEREAIPPGSQFCFSRRIRCPFSRPQPSPPPWLPTLRASSLAASPRQRAPSTFRRTPPFFTALERLQASARLQSCQ
ncbi:hypothetical protein TREES_T100012208 [Tupaia chinensis]|uniref:Uncharacterized protein n=1 Tax=Tupaia chinensis TaxID=246437 RepID=L9JHK5_TUPCH|nr:hypothetical protein TREES_T100012208 [Tupaia chinensis]